MVQKGLKKLRNLLENLGDAEHYIFSLGDFTAVFPEISTDALKMLVQRAVGEGLLQRVCKGLYLYPKVPWSRGLLLYHVGAKLRANCLVYLSLESALSDAGVISQVPLQWVTLMTNGRSGIISCGCFGTIEFIHTKKSPQDFVNDLEYDNSIGLWRASVALAIRDMKSTKRSLDLVDWEVVDEFVQ